MKLESCTQAWGSVAQKAAFIDINWHLVTLLISSVLGMEFFLQDHQLSDFGLHWEI